MKGVEEPDGILNNASCLPLHFGQGSSFIIRIIIIIISSQTETIELVETKVHTLWHYVVLRVVDREIGQMLFS